MEETTRHLDRRRSRLRISRNQRESPVGDVTWIPIEIGQRQVVNRNDNFAIENDSWLRHFRPKVALSAADRRSAAARAEQEHGEAEHPLTSEHAATGPRETR